MRKNGKQKLEKLDVRLFLHTAKKSFSKIFKEKKTDNINVGDYTNMSENYFEKSPEKKKEIDSDIGDFINLKKISALRAAKNIMFLTEKLF